MVERRNDGPGAPAEVWKFLGVGLTAALATALFAYVGLWLDGRFGTRPWLTLVGTFTGAGAGFYYLYYHLVIEPRDRGGRRDGKGGR